MVRDGLVSSSVRYRRRNEGNARNRRVIAGKIVQIVSTSWASIVNRDVNLFMSIVVAA